MRKTALIAMLVMYGVFWGMAADAVWPGVPFACLKGTQGAWSVEQHADGEAIGCAVPGGEQGILEGRGEGSGVISFLWNFSSNSADARMEFWVDGILAEKREPGSGWKVCVVTLWEGGEHVFEWRLPGDSEGRIRGVAYVTTGYRLECRKAEGGRVEMPEDSEDPVRIAWGEAGGEISLAVEHGDCPWTVRGTEACGWLTVENDQDGVIRLKAGRNESDAVRRQSAEIVVLNEEHGLELVRKVEVSQSGRECGAAEGPQTHPQESGRLTDVQADGAVSEAQTHPQESGRLTDAAGLPGVAAKESLAYGGAANDWMKLEDGNGQALGSVFVYYGEALLFRTLNPALCLITKNTVRLQDVIQQPDGTQTCVDYTDWSSDIRIDAYPCASNVADWLCRPGRKRVSVKYQVKQSGAHSTGVVQYAWASVEWDCPGSVQSYAFSAGWNLLPLPFAYLLDSALRQLRKFLEGKPQVFYLDEKTGSYLPLALESLLPEEGRGLFFCCMHGTRELQLYAPLLVDAPQAQEVADGQDLSIGWNYVMPKKKLKLQDSGVFAVYTFLNGVFRPWEEAYLQPGKPYFVYCTATR